MTVYGRRKVLFEQLIQSQLVDDFLLFFLTYIFITVYKTASNWSIYSSRWIQSILSHSVLKHILIWSSHLRLGLLIFLSTCFYSLLPGQYLESATTKSFPISSYCIRVVASCRHCKTNIQFCWISPYTFSLLMFGLKCYVGCFYQYIVHPFFCSAASKCVFDNFNNIQYASFEELCKLLSVLKNTFNDILVFPSLSGRW